MHKDMTIGDRIHNYTVQDIIFIGGEGVIAKAISPDGRPVAIKQMTTEPGQRYYDEAVKRFKRANKLRFNHPNIVDPIELIHENGRWYSIMPFIGGMTLDKYVLARGGKLSHKEAMPIVKQIVDALKYIHRRGCVHRDIKPSNIIIQPDGHVWVIDFGICKMLNEITVAADIKFRGSLPYASPEQVAYPGNENCLSDIYSFGTVVYFMLTGRQTIRGNTPKEVADSIFSYIPPHPCQFDPSIPDGLNRGCMKLLAKRPQDRLQTMDEFLFAINCPPYSVPRILRFCEACKASVNTDARFCSICGADCNAKQNQAARCFCCGIEVAEKPICSDCNKNFYGTDHRFLFREGSLTGSVWRVPQGVYTVGRQQLSPRDYSISRNHLNVACSNGQVSLSDAGSSNKTYVDGVFAKNAIILNHDCEVRIANNVAVYKCQ